MKIRIPTSAGEIIDKVTILEIKMNRIEDRSKVINVANELKELNPAVIKILSVNDKLGVLKNKLYRVNRKLWDIENSIRKLESRKNYGKKFVELARCVYINNDKRAILKNQINLLSGSKILEIKEYSKY